MPTEQFEGVAPHSGHATGTDVAVRDQPAGHKEDSQKHEHEEHGGHPPKPDDRILKVIVYSPRTPDPKTFEWEKTMKVGDAARVAASAFGYTGGHPGLQTVTEPPRKLADQKTLVAEHIKDGDELEIIDTGGGV